MAHVTGFDNASDVHFNETSLKLRVSIKFSFASNSIDPMLGEKDKTANVQIAVQLPPEQRLILAGRYSFKEKPQALAQEYGIDIRVI